MMWMAIPLTQGLFALVDGKFYKQLNQFKWHAIKCKHTYYAVRATSKRKSKRRIVLMHREILGLSNNILTDHKNGCGLDNRKINLRPATSLQNRINSKKRHNCSSKFKGIYWEKRRKKWQVQIVFNKKHISLGLFDNEVEAAKAYDRKAKELFGEFARINF